MPPGIAAMSARVSPLYLPNGILNLPGPSGDSSAYPRYCWHSSHHHRPAHPRNWVGRYSRVYSQTGHLVKSIGIIKPVAYHTRLVGSRRIGGLRRADLQAQEPQNMDAFTEVAGVQRSEGGGSA